MSLFEADAWKGVFPAATTQFAPDLSVDLEATAATLEALIRDGVHGLIVLGTTGECATVTDSEY